MEKYSRIKETMKTCQQDTIADPRLVQRGKKPAIMGFIRSIEKIRMLRVE